jgi:hypothetical protein
MHDIFSPGVHVAAGLEPHAANAIVATPRSERATSFTLA